MRQSCHPPGVHSTYFDFYRIKTDRHWWQQKRVAFATANGLTAAACEFGGSRNTVRKWRRRHLPGKPSALAELSRRPKACPHQTSAALEGVIVRLRQQTACGAERLQPECARPVSHNAIARILRPHQLTRPHKKKPVTQKQLRHIKRPWKLFGQLSTDTKYLQDIPHYRPPRTRLKLPRFPYTARAPVSGACFTGWAGRTLQVLRHLPGRTTRRPSRRPRRGSLRPDLAERNGGEFLETRTSRACPPPGAPLAQIIVTSRPSVTPGRVMSKPSPRLVADEFFDRESFTSPADFWRKATPYWHYFNLVRPHRGKEWPSPLQILRATAPALAGAVLHWRPLHLAKRPHLYLPTPNHRGHDLPSFP